MTDTPFSPAVQRLFELPEPGWAEDPRVWRDYREHDGISTADVADLIEVATDPLLLGAPIEDEALTADVRQLAELNWAAPIHAWRALAQLTAVEALSPLATLLAEGDDWDTDWIHQELVEVFGVYGPPAVPVLLGFIDQPGHPEDAYVAWVEGLVRVGTQHPPARAEVVDALAAQLAMHPTNDRALNAIFVFALVQLQATGVAPLMEAAFVAGRVDESVAGTWEDAQILLGLKPPDAAFHARERERLARMQADELDELGDGAPGAPKKPTAAQKAKKKAKQKLAKASRKKNRKR